MRSQALLEELKWRGQLFQHTEQVEAALDRGQVAGYVGFDPTASSLHVGNMVPLMGLVHLQRAGHRPVALVGGGTGLIGDPSGKASERPLSDAATVAANAAAIGKQLEKFLDFSGPAAARMLDNAEWLTQLKAIDFMRDVGKRFTVNYMLQKESVKGRMEDGISFTEFSYMQLQADNLLELNRRHGVTLQMGGSDQWGNITAGTELIRRTVGGDAHGITMPLITTSSGTKFGKTESGAVWLDAARTSPYKFYQYWINTDDRDASKYLRLFTMLSREEIDALDELIETAPEKRGAQQALARDVTGRVHGTEAARVAEEVSQVLFGKADPTTLSEAVLKALSEEVPFAEVTETPALLDALVALKLAASKSAARRLVEQGGVYLNGQRAGADTELGAAKPLAGRYHLIRKGARDYGLLRRGR